MSTPETKFTRSGDVDIAYQVFGAGARDIVGIPGFASHVEVMWELAEFARYLEGIGRLGRTVVYDKRGSGMSDRPSPPFTLEEHVADLETVMDATGIERASLLGWVDGAAVAAAFAATHPERVEALVLTSLTARPALQVAGDFLNQFQAAIEEHWGEAMMLPVTAPTVADDPRVAAWFRRWERLSATPNAAGAIHRWIMELDIEALLPTVRAPTLVLHRSDVAGYVGDAVRATAELIPGARYVELPGPDLYPFFGARDGLAEVEELLTGVRPAAPEDRVLATLFFTDIVGSTEQAQALGDRRWQDLLAAHHRVVRAELERFGGTEIDTTGDGFFATFEGPARAVRCACAVRDAVRELGMEIRAGVHTGEVTRLGNDLTGISVHVAARVMSHAGSSEVWATQTVKDLVLGSGIEFADRGEHTLKGVPGEWRLYAVASC